MLFVFINENKLYFNDMRHEHLNTTAQRLPAINMRPITDFALHLYEIFYIKYYFPIPL